jgi:HK97 family phage major capsid protein
MTVNTPTTIEGWVQEQQGSDVIQAVAKSSVVDTYGRPETMISDTKKVPRSGDVPVTGVDKNTVYDFSGDDNDSILLTARKAGTIITLADEDMKDSSVATISTKQTDWARGWGKYFDNATLAVTAVGDGSITKPYNSLYYQLKTGGDAAVGYTAGDNYLFTASGHIGATYDNYSELFALVEDSDWWEDENMLLIAHSKFRASLREVKDGQERPIFVAGAGTIPDTVWDVPIKYSRGTKTSATAVSNPNGAGGAPGVAGNPLLFLVNTRLLVVGKRSGPEWKFADADSGPAFTSDQAMLKARARRGFGYGNLFGAAVLELAQN